MSTGADHYRHAEHLAAQAARHITEHPADMRIAEVTATTALVYATLAVAAAQAAGSMVRPSMGDSPDVNDWARAINWSSAMNPRCEAGKFIGDGVLRCIGAPGHEGDHLWDTTEEPPF